MTLSPRWAHLAKHTPCHCSSSAERCVCAAACLEHGEFLRKPATNPNVWPAPDARRLFRADDGWFGFTSPLRGFEGEFIFHMVRHPGAPDPSAPREPREGT